MGPLLRLSLSDLRHAPMLRDGSARVGETLELPDIQTL
ncbi:hypothetical protein TCCBUS3UF1_p270 (plasmid) [Thermus sp. CCB_US3_UF1]|nr:hypothetical protein TCCBUS3UF1_p270 [Thermus sp. CCB_US3_UF1]